MSAPAETMTVFNIADREQFLTVLAGAERLAQQFVQASEGGRQQWYASLGQHLGYMRSTVQDGGFPTAEHKAQVSLEGFAAGLAPGPEGQNTDQPSSWLHASLPALDAFYRGLEPPAPRRYDPGEHVCVRWPNGTRYLAFVRFRHEQSHLVAFANGQQHWMESAQLEPGLEPGQPVAGMDDQGQRVTGTLTERADGGYRIDRGEGEPQWFEWTVVQPA